MRIVGLGSTIVRLKMDIHIKDKPLPSGGGFLYVNTFTKRHHGGFIPVSDNSDTTMPPGA